MFQTGWLVAYLVIILAAAVTTLLRAEPTLTTGKSLLIFNSGFVALWIAVSLLWQQPASPLPTVFYAVVLVGSWIMRDMWLLLHADERRAGDVLEGCLKIVRAPFEKTHAGYVVRLGTESLHIKLRRSFGPFVLIAFAERVRHKKAELIKALFAKQFQPVLPRLRVRTR